MLERNPLVRCDGVRRRNAPPIIDDRFLHPFEIHAIIDMTHVVDVGRLDRNGVTEHR